MTKLPNCNHLRRYIEAPAYGLSSKAYGGTKVDVVLGCNAHLPRKCTTNKLPALLEDACTAAAGLNWADAFISGHLLNDALGGPGDNKANVTILTRVANHNMSTQFEEPLKNACDFLKKSYDVLREAAVPNLNTLPFGIKAHIEVDRARTWFNEKPRPGKGWKDSLLQAITRTVTHSAASTFDWAKLKATLKSGQAQKPDSEADLKKHFDDMQKQLAKISASTDNTFKTGKP